MTNAITFRNNNTFPLTAEEVDDNFQFIAENVTSELLMTFGAVGDGVTNDSRAVAAAEASDVEYINLGGRTYYTTRNIFTSPLTKNYYGEGELIVVGVLGNQFNWPKVAPIREAEIQRLSTKAPMLDLEGANVLWCGTSIPANGTNKTGGGYPERAARSLGFTVVNIAWPGSNFNYDPDGDETNLQTIKCLSMTEDDRVAGVALYGSSSVYDDGDDGATLASEMTMDYRIKAQFDLVAFDMVVLDHNHNDRKTAFGTLSPPSVAVLGVNKGVTTTIALASAGTFVEGSRISLTIAGIPNLNNWSGRVQSVAGNNVTINLDSSGYSGSWTSGTAYLHDTSTLAGSASSVIMYTRWAAYQVGVTDLNIVLCSAPSEYTDDTFDPYIRPNAARLAQIAAHFGCAFYDICYDLAIDEIHHIEYFRDGTHPESAASRQLLANYWTNWLQGGKAKTSHPAEFLPALGYGSTYTSQREALYDRFARGFTTPDFIIGPYVSTLSDDFSGGIGTWTAVGDTPTFVAAPWDAGEDAMFCEHGGAATDTYIVKTGLTFDEAWSIAFDLWLPDVPVVTGGADTIAIMNLRTTADQHYYGMQIINTTVGAFLRIIYFTSPNVGLNKIDGRDILLEADTKYSIQLEAYRATADYPGGLILTVNGAVISPVVEINDSAHSNPTIFRLGIVDSTVSAGFDAYFGNLVIQRAAVLDFTNRFTGSFTAQSGETVTVVNGIITTAV